MTAANQIPRHMHTENFSKMPSAPFVILSEHLCKCDKIWGVLELIYWSERSLQSTCTDTVIYAHNEDSRKWLYSKTSAQTLNVSRLIPLTFVLSAHLAKQTSKRYWTQWLLPPRQGEVSLLPACAIALAQWFMKRRTICAQMGHRYKYSDLPQGGQTTLLLTSGDLWQGTQRIRAVLEWGTKLPLIKGQKNSQNKCGVVFVFLLQTFKAHQSWLFLFWSL